MSRRWPLALRVALAVLAASLAPSLLATAFFGVAILPFAFAIALCHAVLIGVPLYLWIRRRRAVTLGRAAVAGAAIGIIPIQIATLYNEMSFGLDLWVSRLGDSEMWSGELLMLLVLGLSGALAGSMFLIVMSAGGGKGGHLNGPRF